jgi:hypothetical protein
MLSTTIRLWATPSDFITLDYACAQVYYEPSGERIADRNGLVHRITPGGERYPVWLSISILPEELCARNCESASVARSVLEWLELCLRGQSLITVFVAGETLRADASAAPLIRNIAYRGYVEDVSSGLASLPGSASNSAFASGASAGEAVLLRMLVVEDGAFSDFDALGSYSAHEPGRT